jgi:hypothetical protein
MTLADGAWLSSTIRNFSTVVHRRRRSGPDRTETLLTFAHLLANQLANYRRHGCRPEGGPHRRVTLHLTYSSRQTLRSEGVEMLRQSAAELKYLAS